MFAVTSNAGQLNAALDVCRTPSPAGPIPTAYPNTVTPALGQPQAQKLLIAGMPALHQNSACTPSSGNESGSVGGVVSSAVKGPATFTAGSSKVMIEGSPAVRLNDATAQNGNNAVGQVSAPSQGKVMIMS